MSGCDHHDHSCHHHHGDRNLTVAVGINLLLTLAQIAGGIFSGSLALIADALHNFSDAASLLLALVARKISRRKADDIRTFGYRKVETLAAFTNLVILILVSLWLAVEAVMRFLAPEPIEGWTVVTVAALALAIDLATAFLTWKESKTSYNIRAAFLHNIADALSSVAVIVGGILILTLGWTWVDPLLTLLISAYILRHVWGDLPDVINILIDGGPSEDLVPDLTTAIQSVPGVANIHHVHLRYLDERRMALEAHILLEEGADIETVKAAIKSRLSEQAVEHSTLEFETKACTAPACGVH